MRLSFLLAVLGVSLNGGEVKVRSKARERHYAFGRTVFSQIPHSTQL